MDLFEVATDFIACMTVVESRLCLLCGAAPQHATTIMFKLCMNKMISGGFSYVFMGWAGVRSDEYMLM